MKFRRKIDCGAWASLGQKLEVSGNIQETAFFYSSDARLKYDTKALDASLEKILSLSGVTYKWRTDGNQDIGLIA